MLVLFHPQQDVGQGCDGFYDVRPFIEHDALGPFAHGGVGNFSSRREALFDQVFKDLGRPNDRHVGSFADPHDFFLKFCQAPIADFNGQVTAGNHDAEGLLRCGLNDDFRQVVDGLLIFDFGYQGNLAVSLTAALLKFPLQEGTRQPLI